MIGVKMFQVLGLLFLCLSLSLVIGFGHPKMMERIADGPWGGEHVRIEVTEKSASVEFDCAHGTIEGPLTIDSEGQFKWKGTFSREHGGPIRSDENSSGRPALYSGSIKGKRMTLVVRLEGQDEPIDTFTLTQGSNGRLTKCL